MKYLFPENKKAACEYIKITLERLFTVKDIGKRTREREYIESRKFYVALCKEFTKCNLSDMGRYLGGYDHATMLHHRNSFKDLMDIKDGFDNIDYYHRARKTIRRKINSKPPKKRIHNTLDEVEKDYRVRLFKVIEKYRSIINRKDEEIQQLKNEAIRNIEVDLQAV